MATYYSNTGATVTSSSKPKPDSDQAIAEKHLKAVIELLTTQDEVPKNILLIGRPAAGKSSLINLFRTALTNKYEEVSTPGNSEHGMNDSVTTHLQYFQNMGLSRAEMSKFQQDRGLDVKFQLPTLMDMPGIDMNKAGNGEILKYIVDGAVPSDTDVTDSITRYNFNESNMKGCEVDRIIFVISVAQDIPEKFLEEVMSVICFTGGNRKRVPYIVIFTHNDCVSEHSGISEATVKERKKIALGILNLGKNSKLNSYDVTCYSDKDPCCEEEVWRYKIDYKKHIEALRALCILFRRRHVIDNRTQVNHMTLLADYAKFVHKKIGTTSILAIVVVIIIAIIFYRLWETNTKITGNEERQFRQQDIVQDEY